ncbi:hypothetical protein A6R68_13268, partial [Neotoma lepida]
MKEKDQGRSKAREGTWVQLRRQPVHPEKLFEFLTQERDKREKEPGLQEPGPHEFLTYETDKWELKTYS